MDSTVEPFSVYAVSVVVFFVALKIIFSQLLKLSDVVATAYISLIHHCAVVGYSLCFNYSYMQMLHDGFRLAIDTCSPLKHSTSEIYQSGLFSVVYLFFDSIYGLYLQDDGNKNKIDKLLLFHHLNGVVLISAALKAQHGQYMASCLCVTY